MTNSSILKLPILEPELEDYILSNYKKFNVVNIWPQLSFEIYEADKVVTQWVNKNISSKWMSIRIFFIGKVLPIHVDINRDVVYNYVIKSGNGVTSFYEFNDKSLYNFYKFSQKIIARDLVELIEYVKIPEKTWFKINCGIPHSVTELTDSRILLTISFKKDFTLIDSDQNEEI